MMVRGTKKISRHFFFMGIMLACALVAFIRYERRNYGSISYDEENPIVCFVQTLDDADCILIKQGEDSVMIDTGEVQDTERILAVLDRYGVDELDAMILTHPDKDHIGGAAEIAQAVPVDYVLEPYYTLQNDRRDVLMEVFAEKEIPVRVVEQTQTLEFEKFSLTVYPPEEPEYEKDNNYSLAVLFTCGENHALFTGDAMKKRQKELLNYELPQIELLKVPYHGRYVKGEEELLQKLSPEYAVITAKTAETEVVSALNKIGAETFYTRFQTVTFQTDGKNFFVIKP